jgi:two-component system, NtrC family, response regulator HydG
MEAELIVLEGPQSGTRFLLGLHEARAGRSAGADIRLHDSAAAGDHCLFRPQAGGHCVVDRDTEEGTFVNGRRVSQASLAPGDRIAIGGTVLLYRQAAPAEGGRTLLQACSLLFLFRALAATENQGYRETIETQLTELLHEMIDCAGVAAVLGGTAAEIAAQVPGRLRALVLEAAAEGSAAAGDALAVSLWVRGKLAGALAAWFAQEPPANARDALGAVAALAAAALESQVDLDRLRTENRLLRDRVDSAETGIAGESILIHKLLAMIVRLAPLDTVVLITGETGCGKELVARALHRLSPRAAHPFVAINCAALTETLLESELFGHEKGAFTGAVAQKQGKLEAAGEGTVLLDEIGEMALSLQAKLLRVLQQREFERVGGTRTMRLEGRIVAATNRDLRAEVRKGTFREDLYHRLNVVTLRVPPLRERTEDVLPLARYFLERSAVRCGRAVSGFSAGAERCLSLYGWPGNVRELENAVERAVVLGDTDLIQAEDLPETVVESAPHTADGLQSSVSETKRNLILAAWRESGGDHNKTAERLNIHPNSLRRLLRVLNLRDLL